MSRSPSLLRRRGIQSWSGRRS